MRELHIKKTTKTPSIITDNGTFELMGVSIPEDARMFYSEVIDWVEEYIETSHRLTMVFKSIYYNSVSVKCISNLILKAKDVETLTVVWFYEEDDEDMFDLGEMLSLVTGVEFFIESKEEIPTYEGPTQQDNS